MRHSALRGCLIALFLLSAAGISISKDVHSKPPNDNAKFNGAGANPQGTAPAPIIVNVPAPQKTAEEKEEAAKDRAEKSSNDGKIVEFTRQLASYTFGLFVATGALFLATGVLAILGWRQARDMAKSLDLARQEFIATHRPRIIVQFIQGPFDDGIEPEFVWVTVTNVGETPATITAIGSDLARRQGRNFWLPPGISADLRDITPSVLESGERLIIQVKSKTVTSDANIAADALGDFELCAVGQIRYQDGNGRTLEMAFLRVHDGHGNFTPSDNPEDEYQD